MLLGEFIQLSGFHPSPNEYKKIEEDYYNFVGDKQAFVKQWKRNKGIEGCSSRMVCEILELEESIKQQKHNNKILLADRTELERKVRFYEWKLSELKQFFNKTLESL